MFEVLILVRSHVHHTKHTLAQLTCVNTSPIIYPRDQNAPAARIPSSSPCSASIGVPRSEKVDLTACFRGVPLLVLSETAAKTCMRRVCEREMGGCVGHSEMDVDAVARCMQEGACLPVVGCVNWRG